MKLSDNALEVLNKRYFLKNFKGEPIEDWDGLCSRVAEYVASAESKEEENRWTTAFHSIMYNLDFLPNSPTLRNAGANQGNLSACFVLPIEDSRKSIFKTLQDAVEVQAFGGGTGYDFSNLRPEGSLISTTKGKSCGPLGFMRVFDFVIGEVIQQGGVRHGAQMGILRIDHPDIERFIDCKKEEGKLNHFNISVAVTDEFMDLVNSARFGDTNYSWLLQYNGKKYSPREYSPDSITVNYLWGKILEGAWANGEPGIIFIDRVNQLNPLKDYETISATNPCGEQPLAPYSSCNLGSINLSNFVDIQPQMYFSQKYSRWPVDWMRLRKVVKIAVRFLDNVIDVNNYPIPEIEEETKKFRKIGLGVMGWADMLIKLKISYNSQEALDLAGRVMEFINETAWDYSVELAHEKGNITWFDSEKGYINIGRRNGTLTTIAPTGTLSLIAGCSAGIEPVFSFKYKKKCLDGEIEVLHPLYEEWRNSQPMDDWGKYRVPDYFIKSEDIPIEQHVKMQAAFQKYTDNAVSKTINAPFEATMADVDKAFRLAYEFGCKGITFYRQGSREVEAQKSEPKLRLDNGRVIDESVAEVIYDSGLDKPKLIARVSREAVYDKLPEGTLDPPEWMLGGRQKIKTGEGTLWVHLFEDPDTGYKEIWSQISKEGRTISSMNAAVGRLGTLALNKGATWEDVEKQLRGIIGERTAWYNGEQVLSPPDGIAKVIRRRVLNNDEWPVRQHSSTVERIKDVVEGSIPSAGSVGGSTAIVATLAMENTPSQQEFIYYNKRELCPDCGSALHYGEGCKSGLCQICGWSSCS